MITFAEMEKTVNQRRHELNLVCKFEALVDALINLKGKTRENLKVKHSIPGSFFYCELFCLTLNMRDELKGYITMATSKPDFMGIMHPRFKCFEVNVNTLKDMANNFKDIL